MMWQGSDPSAGFELDQSALGGTPALGPQPISAINTTPLVDVMLVLLIIFMITIPAALSVHTVDPPQAESQASANSHRSIQIAVDAHGQIFWMNTPMPDELALQTQVKTYLASLPPAHRTDMQAMVHADRQTPYRCVAEVLRALQTSGVTRVQLVAGRKP